MVDGRYNIHRSFIYCLLSNNVVGRKLDDEVDLGFVMRMNDLSETEFNTILR